MLQRFGDIQGEQKLESDHTGLLDSAASPVVIATTGNSEGEGRLGVEELELLELVSIAWCLDLRGGGEGDGDKVVSIFH
jgi:hypothetical protein